MTTVCIYTRISSDPDADNDGDDGGKGVARQEEDARALADRNGWTVGRVFTDNDVSAYSGKTRPQFEAMLSAIRRGEFDALVCWHQDRLYRSIKDMERVIEVCETAGVPIKTVCGGDLDLGNATGKAVARILGSVSRMESEHKAERQRRANIQRAQAGSWWSSHRVFGYEQDGTVRESEAALIRQGAADVLTGLSVRALARRWNTAGVTTVKGAEWQPKNLKAVLINPRHAGLRSYRGTVVGPGDWQAIIDVDTHHGLLAILNDPSRGPRTVSYERKYIGSRRYLCGRCGAPLHHTIAGKGHRYVCTRSAHLARSQPLLDEFVEAVALEYLRDEGKVAALLAAATGPGEVDTAALRTRRAALVAQRDELATLFTDGVLDGPGVRRESGKLAASIAAIDETLAEAARRSPVAELMSAGVEELDARWSAASPDMKGKIVDELFTVVVNPAPRGRYFNPEYVDIRWNV